jgi:hypothetical protein
VKLSDFGTRIKAKTLSSNMSAIRRLHHKFRNLFLIEQKMAAVSKMTLNGNEWQADKLLFYAIKHSIRVRMPLRA